MSNDQEPFFNDPEPNPIQDRIKRARSPLARSIVVANPTLADKTDAQLVTAHHRCLWNKFSQHIEAWRTAGGRDRERLAIERLDAARNKTIRECISDLVGVGMTVERAQEIAAAVVAGEDEYRAVMATLCEALFA